MLVIEKDISGSFQVKYLFPGPCKVSSRSTIFNAICLSSGLKGVENHLYKKALNPFYGCDLCILPSRKHVSALINFLEEFFHAQTDSINCLIKTVLSLCIVHRFAILVNPHGRNQVNANDDLHYVFHLRLTKFKKTAGISSRLHSWLR